MTDVFIKDNEEKIKTHNEMIKEVKQELKDVRIRVSRIQSELNGELAEERQLEARLDRLKLQKSFLTGFIDGLKKFEESN